MMRYLILLLAVLFNFLTAFAQAPSNDLCSGAITIPNDGSCYNNGTTFNATDNNETGDCTTGTENAVWYKFVASAATMTIRVTGSTNFDPVIKVLNNCGVNTSPTGGACIDATGNGGEESLSLTGLTIGSTYYVQVHEYSGEVTSTSTFTICALPPANECSGAQLITLTNGIESCLNAESLSGLNVSSTSRPSCWPARTYSGDKWYRFVAVGTDISIEIQNLDNGYDNGNSLQYCSGALYGGTCSGLNLLNCTYVNTGSFDAAFAYYNLTPGQTYYLRISGVESTGFLASNTESYNLCIKNNTVNSSNAGDCVSAVPICQTTNSFSILSNAQGNYENEINTAYTCTDKEVGSTWYTFTAQSTGNFTFLITPNVSTEDFDWALFNITNKSCLDIASDGSMLVSCNATGGSGCNGNTGANVASGGYNVQGGGCGNNPPTVESGNTPFNAVIPVVAGNTYALYVSNWSGTTNGYSINFSGSSAGVLDLTGPTLAGIDNPSCGATSITIRFSENVLCSSLNVSNFTLSGPGGPYTLSNLVGDNCANGGTYSKVYTATVSPAMRDAGSFTISYNGTASDICGNTTPSTSVSINVTNSVPNANITQADFEVCSTSTALNGNLPAGYTGIWSSSDATITFTPATGATTTVGNLKPGQNIISYVLRDALGCEGLLDNVTITNNTITTIADISTTLLTTCNGSISLTGNTPASGETGTWSIPSGATISSGTINSPSITIANLPLGNSNITWTISRGSCPSNSETVVVNNSQVSTSATITSPANNTQVCNNTATLVGINPGATETGTWTLPSGVSLTSGTLNSTNISVTGLSSGNNTFTWTISSGSCPPSAANVVIINNSVVTIANITTANNTQSCDGNINLSANSPLPGETGTWSIPSGATISSGTLNSTNITLTNLPIGTSTVTWTITRGSCPSSSSTINIINNRLQTTSTILSPANNSQVCTNNTSLSANSPASGETGTWTIPSGVTLTSGTLNSTNISVTGLAPGNNNFTWTISRGTCPPSVSNITIINNSVQTAAITTPQGTIACDGNILLNGNTLLSGETGTWSTATSGASVTPILGNSTTATLANGINTFTYTITKGSCSSSANVNITNTAVTTANITQNSPLELCTNTTTLNGNALGANETPSWSIISGGTGATLSGASTTTLSISNLPSGNTIIRYTITKTLPSGNCTSFEDITITNNQITPLADITTTAQSTCGNCISLNAIAGANGATGLWTLPSGITLSSGTTSSNSITACNLNIGANNFIWTLTKGTCTSTDNVIITKNNSPQISETHTDVTTVNGNDGSIEVCINNGTAPYSIVVSPTLGTVTDIGANGTCLARYRITGLTRGNYSVTVTDANTCTAQISNIPINDPNCTSMTIQSVTSTNELCNESNNGSISIQVLNGIGNITYNIGNGVTSATSSNNPYTFNNLQAGNYNVQATDSRGCSVSYLSNPVIITQPNVLSATSTVTNTTTVGGTDGVYCISINGGTAPYNVTSLCGSVLSGAGTCGGQFNLPNQSQGSCTFNISDLNGCSISTNNAITDPTCNLSIQGVNSTNVLCNGANNGTITINITGNRPPFQYSINGGTTYVTDNLATHTFNGLAPGSYSVQVKDAINCSVNYTLNPITITQPNILSASANTNATTTVGGNDGSINVCINGGTAPYTISYSPNTGSSTSVSGVCEGNFLVSGLIAQCYNIIVTDSKACTYNLNNICVAGPNCSTMTIQNVSATNETCNQNNDGSIRILVQNAVGNITYSIGNGVPNVTNNTNPYTFLGLQAGNYTVQVTDTRGCSVSYLSNPVILTQPNPLSVNTNVQNVSTVGGNDGAICLTVSGGTPLYSVTSSCGTVTASAGICGGNYNISNIAAQTCTFSITDANNCSTSTSATVNDPSCTLAIVNVTNTNVLCNGANNGTISVTLNGGTPPYRIYLDGGTTPHATISSLNYTANNLSNGTYNIVVRDALNCSVSYSNNPIIITQPNILSATAVPTSTTIVNGNDGKISLCINGGTAPYTITYTPNTGAINNISGTCALNREIIGLIAGCYNIVVKDANNCEFILNNVCVQDPDCSTFRITDVSKTNETCNQNNNGSIIITTTNGIGALTFAVGNGILNQVSTNAQVSFSPLSAGNYNVQVTDSRGCVVNYLSNPVIITEPNILNVSANVTNVSTVGGNDGALCFTLTGGTPNYSITSSCGIVNNGPGSCGGNYNISGLSSGNCSYTVTDANGCTITSQATINDPTCTLSISNVVSNNLTCNGNNLGTITVSINGGTPPFTYIENGNTFATTSNTSATANGLSAGNHSISVIDATNCSVTYSANPVILTEPNVLTLNASPFDANTIGGNDGKIVICVNGGTPNYTISISPNSGILNTVAGACNGNFEITGLGQGTYSINVQDGNGCTIAQNNIVIAEPNCTGFTVTNVVKTDITCNNNTDGQIDISVSGGNPPYQYSIFNGAAAQSSASNNYIFTGLGVACYSIRVTDASNCSIGYINNPICITEPTILSSSVIQFNPTTLGGSNGEICITPNGGTAPYSITCVQLPSNIPQTVLIGNGINCNGAFHVSNLPSGNYYIEVRDGRGCLSTGTVTLNEPLCSAQPPIVFNGNNTFEYQCNGDGTATINILVSGGFGPEYTITGLNGVTPINATTTAGGNYTFTVQTGTSWSISAEDRAGCTSSSTLSDLFEEGVDACANCNTIADININGNNSYAYQCNGDGTATLSFTPSGGSGAPYNVSGSGFTSAVPATVSGTITLTVLTGNTWSITFTDRTACKSRTLSDLFEEGVDACANCNTIADININGNNSYAYQCNGDGTATLSFTPSGGSGAPYNVSGSGFTSAVPATASGTITLTVLTGNTWSITFTDRTACKSRTLSDLFEEGVDACANCNTIADININGNNSYAYQCNGDGTATLSFTPSGGSGAPYNVSGSGFTSAVPATASGTITLTVLTGNTWSITFTDRTACKSRTLSDLFEEGVDACANCNTIADININGNNSYAYQCNGDGTATLSFTPSGGSGAPYNVSGSGFTSAVPATVSGTITLTVLTGNTWSITFTDRTACKSRTLSDLFEEGVDACANCNTIADININGNNSYAYQCNGDGTATLSFTPSGGSGAPYNVSGSGFTSAVPATASGTITLTVLTGNTWSITFTDRTACKSRTLSDLFEEGVDACANCNTVADININGNNSYAYQCNGDGTATLSFTPSGGSGAPYNVSGSGFTSAVPATASGTITLTVLTGNTWSITFTDRTACKSRTLSDLFEEGVDACANCNTVADININGNNSYAYQCNGDGTATLSFTPSGGSGAPYNVSGSGFTSAVPATASGTITLTVLTGNTWSITFTDRTACKSRTLSDLFEEGVDACANCSGYPPLTLNNNNTFEYNCKDNGDAIVDLDINGGSGIPYIITLNINGTQTINTISTNNYSFNVSNGDEWFVNVTDHLGCASRNIGDVNNPIHFVNATADILINNQALDSITIDIGDRVTLNASGGLYYQWSPITWLNNINTDVVIAKPESTIWYTVNISNDNGCSAKDSVLIRVFDPNDCIETEYIFSPNGDGNFDTWVVTCLLLERPNVMEVFNRWGQKLISFNNYDSNWDGTVNGIPLPDGTYYFLFKGIKYNTDIPVVYRGTVTIIR
jgi:gliding motility-associated-like protein